MRVLVTWGSKHGGTEGIGRILGEALETHGFDVVMASVDEVNDLRGFEAVIVGGGLYANRWPKNARRFVAHNVALLREVPVWFFSSGPLDDSADREDLPASRDVAVLAEWVGANGHVTFGGRLDPATQGFPASAMAKSQAGDWRNPERIRAWAAELAEALPTATPGEVIDPAGRSVARLLAHAIGGWALSAATLSVLLRVASLLPSLVLHAIAAPLYFAAIAWHYFGARGARDPLPTAVTFTAVTALLDFVVAGVVQQRFAVFASALATWLPLALIFLCTWVTGAIMSTMPWPKERDEGRAAHRSASR